ncbi:MAG: aminomethyltransferase family protein [Candidatus Eremiobacteraeota bacterium]|nr:aminomethyltransferase family protein [Candidatus Eremiobacteraeota bacterium]MCW5865993.1 aminomethyltransferase family protein [Candidatus Eremiobacteraeota bacterium]
MMLRLKTTPFHPRTEAIMQANQWRRWGGYSVASAYEMTHDREYLAMRNACALLDVSALYKYEISGPDAHAFLNRLVTRDISQMQPGGMAYTPWCDSQGKVVDDGTICRLDEGTFRLTAADPNYHWLEENTAGFDIHILDVSEDLGTLALQGPCSRDVLAEVFGEAVRELPFYGIIHVENDLQISRTGYSGDLGYEVWVPSGRAVEIWDRLTEAGKRYALQPAGIWALDVARIEAGLIMLDVDYTPANKATTPAQASTPYELGLGWSVHLKKPHFVGKKALAKEKAEGSALTLVGLEIDHQALASEHEKIGLPVPFPFVPWREIVPIFNDEGQVGYATCGSWSPTLKKYLALAQVKPGSGEDLKIDIMVDRFRKSFGAKVRKLPFFNPPRKRG